MKIFGIPITFGWSFWLLILVIAWPFSPLTIWLAFIIPATVLVHELGHSLAAKYLGYNVKGIHLFALGGLAHIENLESSDLDEDIFITWCGPFVNIIIAAVFFILNVSLISLQIVSAANPFLAAIWVVNAMIGFFNLFPAFPMDGGRLLRAFLAKITDYQKATNIATIVAILLGIAMAGLSIVIFNVILLLISGFVIFAAFFERKRVLGEFL